VKKPKGSGLEASRVDFGLFFTGLNPVAWRIPLAFQIIFCTPIMAFVMSLPESPRWLISRAKKACYAGAIGAPGMHALQAYGQAEPTYDNKSYTFSSTYHEGTLKIYAHHPTQPSRRGESAQYHITPLRGFLLTDSPQTFRQGVGAFRNARDLAKKQREIFIEKVNAVARAQSVDTMPFDTSHATVTSMQERLIDSDASADELALDYPFTMTRIKRQKKEQTRLGTPRSMQEEPSSMRGEPRSM
jgi:hypothetical protein